MEKLKNVKEWENALLNKSYIIMSVDRTENTVSHNKTSERNFRKILKRDKVEFYEIDGVYDEPDVTERSFIIFTEDEDKWRKYVDFATTVYLQESILIHIPLYHNYKPLFRNYDIAVLKYLNYEKKGTEEILSGLTVRTFKFQKTYISKVIGQNIYFAFGVDLKRRVKKRA